MEAFYHKYGSIRDNYEIRELIGQRSFGNV